jgi:hypothetical protein
LTLEGFSNKKIAPARKRFGRLSIRYWVASLRRSPPAAVCLIRFEGFPFTDANSLFIATAKLCDYTAEFCPREFTPLKGISGRFSPATPSELTYYTNAAAAGQKKNKKFILSTARVPYIIV